MLLTSLTGLAFGIFAAITANWELIIPAVIATAISIITWFTRVKTTVTNDRITFFQLGKTIQVPIPAIHSCSPHGDSFGLGAGLRWLGRKQWGMLSGDSYVEIRYGEGASLLASHRSAEELCAYVRGGQPHRSDPA